MTRSEQLAWTLILPGPLDRLTGGTIYDRRMVEGARAAGDDVAVISLPGTYPEGLSDADRAAASAALARAAESLTAESQAARSTGNAAVVIDGLVLSALRDELVAFGARHRWIALVHHPVSEEPGIAEARRAVVRGAELAAIAAARSVICTSAFTARVLRTAGVSGERIRVVEPGVDLPAADGGAGPGRDQARPLRLLCVANLMERKGLDVLFTALAGLRGRWRLTLVGSADHEPQTAAALVARADGLGIGDRIDRVGTVASDRLSALYRDADLFVFPSRYEGYGMVLTEAAAHGLPIVTTDGGAIPDTVRELTADVVPVGDDAAFAAGVQRYLDDPEYRTRRRAAADAKISRLTRWDQAVARFRDAIREGTAS